VTVKITELLAVTVYKV